MMELDTAEAEQNRANATIANESDHVRDLNLRLAIN